jgi:hypothetical protein
LRKSEIPVPQPVYPKITLPDKEGNMRNKQSGNRRYFAIHFMSACAVLSALAGAGRADASGPGANAKPAAKPAQPTRAGRDWTGLDDPGQPDLEERQKPPAPVPVAAAPATNDIRPDREGDNGPMPGEEADDADSLQLWMPIAVVVGLVVPPVAVLLFYCLRKNRRGAKKPPSVSRYPLSEPTYPPAAVFPQPVAAAPHDEVLPPLPRSVLANAVSDKPLPSWTRLPEPAQPTWQQPR